MKMNETRNWFQAQIPLVYKPTYLDNLSNWFGLKANGKVKSSQWRVFGEIYGPLICAMGMVVQPTHGTPSPR
ncbi:hypothetical protein I308_104721 [Cryptococcus tetragattii IND107]|uniref:Uncharacterized protein n=1 Tax=Cryptococcus tetragattii IND107 TaxID=1296105 RepID=A0ABR3BNE6_9TREE